MVLCVVICVLRSAYCVSWFVYHAMSVVCCVVWCGHVGFCVV